jgi:hypothetical protein
MTVTQLTIAAFRLAASRCPELHKTWISISVRVGGLLPNSRLIASVQRTGELDMVLRCMEDDYSPPQEGAGEADLFSCHYQKTLSELWVGDAYEIFRLLTTERKLALDSDVLALARDLKLLRIPLEKHEIADDKKLPGPLLMQRHPPNDDETDSYHYSHSDAQKAHIMPSGISSRGSVMWNVIDVKSKSSYWLERRALSERIVALWGP